MTDHAARRSVLHSPAAPLLWSLLFLGLFVAVFYLQKPTTLAVDNATIKMIVTKYGAASGTVLALLGLLIMYFIAGIKRIVGLRRFRILNPLVVLVVALPALAFGWELLYKEPRYTDIARAIIGYLAQPLFLSSLVISALALLWLVLLLLRPLLRRR
jgi:hypothetical protein